VANFNKEIPNFSISCCPQTTVTFVIRYFSLFPVSVFQYKEILILFRSGLSGTEKYTVSNGLMMVGCEGSGRKRS